MTLSRRHIALLAVAATLFACSGRGAPITDAIIDLGSVPSDGDLQVADLTNPVEVDLSDPIDASTSDAPVKIVPSVPHQVLCGSSACDTTFSGHSFCCGSLSSAGMVNGHCQDLADNCSGDPMGGNVTLLCDGPEDCDGQLCWGENGGGYLSSVCRATGGLGEEQLCHDGTQCPSGQQCCPVKVFANGPDMPLPYGSCVAASC